jgi:parallel beta-helix repeat protein
MVGIGAFAGVQASASGIRPAIPSNPPQALGALRSTPMVHAGPRASATVGGTTTTVTCGQTISASTTLTADLNCPTSDGLYIAANSVVLNLNGHVISGSLTHSGILTSSNSDTIENGSVLGFNNGVYLNGFKDIATKLTLDNGNTGAFVAGFSDQVTSSTAAANHFIGMLIGGYGAIIKANHVLNNSSDGISANGHGTQVLDNIANGNGHDGIIVSDSAPATLTGNTADFNDLWGIYATPPQIDGGTNKAQGNTQHEQCYAVVC